ncbi:hypothetical protein VroAM7_39140 [Vibrio rotiferianus]|uniref:Uncharacterized protein n=1 Tax=Vibrio rotiferianus TaxID=190895 RepID=A0A510ICU0_9VIBR|nr:hypothetical protein VroAM7_39140 [Vibrio rotiferianus]
MMRFLFLLLRRSLVAVQPKITSAKYCLLGSVDLLRLNFVRDKIVLGEARSVSPSHSKQILLNKA